MKKTSFFNKLVSLSIFYTLLIYVTSAKAGYLVGNFESQVLKYKDFADSFNTKSIGYLVFFDKSKKIYQACSGTLIKSGKDIDPRTNKQYVGGWVLTSAHCGIGSPEALGAKFVTEQGEADVDAFIPHFRYKKDIPYAEGINKKGEFTCVATINKPCKNTPQQALYDIALVHINKDLTTTGLKPISPPKALEVPSNGFIGGFVGYGKQGGADPLVAGKTQLKTGALYTLSSDPNNESMRLYAAFTDRLGGKNFFNVLKYSATSASPATQVLYADFDNGTTSKNVDRQPDTMLNLEFSPYYADSGAGVFDANNKFVAIVSGLGYGNIVSSGNIVSFTPPNYGSITFFTPLAQHRGWIAAAIKANKFKTFTSKAYVPTNEYYSPVILTTGGLTSVDNSLLPDSMMNIFADVINEPYPEVFDEAVWEEIFPSEPVS